MIKSFVKDSAIYAIPSILSRGLAIILIPLYTRVLNPADFGSLDLLIAFATFINLTIALEVSQGIARFYSSEKSSAKKITYVSSGFWFTLICYTLFLIAALAVSKQLAAFVMGKEGLEVPFQAGVVYIFINGIFYLIQNQFRWELRSVHYAVVSISVTVVSAVLSVVFTYGLGLGLLGILLGMIGGALIGCIYGLWYLRHTFCFQFKWLYLKEMLIFSAPLVPSGVAVFVTLYIDRLMINHFLSIDEVGVFGIGYRFASVAGLVMVGFQGALTPLILSNYQNEQTAKHLALIFRGFIIFALMTFVSLSLFANEILYVMTTPDYYPAAELVVFLIPAILLSNMYIFAPGITIAKKTSLIMYIHIGGAILNVILNLILIPAWGLVGAAISTLSSYITVFVAYMLLSQRFYYAPHQWRPIFIAVTVSFFIAYWVSRLDMSTTSVVLKLLVIVLTFMYFVRIGLVKLSELHKMGLAIKHRFLS